MTSSLFSFQPTTRTVGGQAVLQRIELGWESDAGQLQALSVQLKTSLAQKRELIVDWHAIEHGNYQATTLN